MGKLPEIKKYNGIDTLFIDNAPFIILGGEIHNSSASDLAYMDKNIWPNLDGLNLNTVIVPIYWELIEKVEGSFDHSLMDGIIQQARRNRKHLVLIWFGLWKNSESTYIPAWMKKDAGKYFRARKVNGEPINSISPFCQSAIENDARALAHVMAHLKEIDESENTVIAIQVENEIGLLGTDRDYSELAEVEFSKSVPVEIEKTISRKGHWKDCFGAEAGEYFMAYHFAKAVEFITKAAQSEYHLPCYANAWLRQFPWYAGSYPSGGPVATMHKVWKLVAPSLFCLAPDIYVPYVPQVMEEYTRDGNALFIPEIRKDAITASYALYAFGHFNAIAYSPFAIEDLALDPDEIDKPPMEVMLALNIDPSAFETGGSKGYLAKIYGLMENIKPLYFQHRGTPHLKSYVKQADTDLGVFLTFEQYDLQISYSPRQPKKPLAAGMIFEVGDNSFFIIGMMSTIKIFPKPGENVKVEILHLEEGEFKAGEWKAGRTLNGDEKYILRCNDNLSCFFLELFKY